MFECDLDGDGNLDILVLSQEPRSDPQRGWEGLAQACGERLCSQEEPLVRPGTQPVGHGGTNGDKKDELLVADTGYVRAVVMRGDELEVLDQFNARSAKDGIFCPFTMPTEPSKLPQIWYYCEDGRLDVLEKSKDGVYRFLQSNEVAPFPIQSLVVRSASGGGSSEILALGKHTFRRIPLQPNAALPRLVVIHRFNSDIRDVHHTAVDSADFNSDGIPDLVGLDPSQHLLEFFRLSPDGSTWESAMHFRIFEKTCMSVGTQDATGTQGGLDARLKRGRERRLCLVGS